MATENITSLASFLAGEMCVENELKFIKCHGDLGLSTLVWQDGISCQAWWHRPLFPAKESGSLRV